MVTAFPQMTAEPQIRFHQAFIIDYLLLPGAG